MKRSRYDGEEVVRAIELVCGRSVPRTHVDGITLTPLEKQVVSIKHTLAPHVILLVACGYRVRLFGRDSHVISRRCGIMCIPGQPFEYSSVPYFRVNLYVHRLVSMGYHVAFADQESAAVRAASGTKSGIFTRLVSRWFSRATLLPSERVHTNGDVANDAAKAGASASTASASSNKPEAGEEVQEEAAEDDAHDGDGEANNEQDAEGEAGTATAATTTATRHRFGDRPRAVDASELFMCFIQVPQRTQAAGSTAVTLVDSSAESIESVDVADVPVVTETVDALPCDVVLVSFVTQRRRTLRLQSALDLEDMLQSYDVTELILACPRNRTEAVSSAASAALGPVAVVPSGLTYLSAAEGLAALPQPMLRVLQATLSLHLGPTITGEEDGKSVSVCTCVMPAATAHKTKHAETTTKTTTVTSALDELVLAYLKPYQLNSVYERLLPRQGDGAGAATAVARRASSAPPSSSSSSEAVPSVMSVTGATLRALDVFHSSIGAAGSLLHLIDHSLTACGGRRLRAWLAAPLCTLSAIEARQACVAYLIHGFDGGFVEDVLRECNRIGDVEATIGKLFAQRCTVPEYVRLLRTTRAVHTLATEMLQGGDEAATSAAAVPQLLKQLLAKVCSLRAMTFMHAHAWEMDSQCQTPLELIAGQQQARKTSGGTRVSDAASSSSSPSSPLMTQMDALLVQRDAAMAALDAELESARRATKLPGLQYQTISGTAFLLDLPKAKAEHVPADWVVISRTRSNVRFHTPRITDANVQLCAANERLVGVAAAEWQRRQAILCESTEDMHVLSAVVELVGTLDALRSLAMTSRASGYTKPTLLPHPNTPRPQEPSPIGSDSAAETACVSIRDGRHPVLDALLQHQYVACDVEIGAGQTWLLTGPNMGGKSALMRMIGTFALLAQMGCYVPAASATLPVFTGVYTRMGASDAILEGSSTFLMEMEETSRLLAQPNLSSSLVLMDELGRGTSSFDGAAVAAATLDYLVTHKCTCVFVTHYSYLCDPWLKRAAAARAAGTTPTVNCFYMGFRRVTEAELDTEAETTRAAAEGIPRKALIFTYKPCPGVTPSSFGVDVARMAGLPESVLDVAKRMSEKGERALRVRLDIAELGRLLGEKSQS